MNFRLKGPSLYRSSAYFNKNTIASTSGHQSWQLLDVECKPNSWFSLVFFKKRLVTWLTDKYNRSYFKTTTRSFQLWLSIHSTSRHMNQTLKRVPARHCSGTPNSNSIKQTILLAPVIAKYMEKSWTSIKRNLVRENIFCQTLDLLFYRGSSALVYS